MVASLPTSRVFPTHTANVGHTPKFARSSGDVRGKNHASHRLEESVQLFHKSLLYHIDTPKIAFAFQLVSADTHALRLNVNPFMISVVLPIQTPTPSDSHRLLTMAHASCVRKCSLDHGAKNFSTHMSLACVESSHR
ncbi:hypothetical protein GW750_02430 [bacterium]|nr:hypothetical protein [bacterium]